MDPQSFNVERTEYWKIAQDRLEETDRDKKDDNDKQKNKWKSLYTEERYAEPSAKWLDATRRKVVQWRMKERVRFSTTIHHMFCGILASRTKNRRASGYSDAHLRCIKALYSV
jgi:hypothetical protein